MKEKLFPIVALLMAFSLLFGGLFWINTQLLTRIDDAGEHFFVSWMRARSFITDGENPYSEAVMQDVQVAVYGRYAQNGEYSYALDVPLYKLFVYFPFALFSDFQIAFALWMTFSELALFAIGFLSVNLSGWQPSALSGILFYLTLFFSFYGFYPLLGGSGTIFAAFFLLLMLLAIREGWDEVLGILLLFGTFFPAKGGVLFLLILVWLAYHQRWSVFSIALMSVATLWIVSFLILPGWFSSYYEVLSGNLNLVYGFFLRDFLASYFPDTNILLSQILRWVFLSVLLLEWFNARQRSFEHLLWVAALSVVVVPFFDLPFSPYFFTLFLFPLPLLLKSIEDRWGSHARFFSVFVLVFVFASWFAFIKGESALPNLSFVFPALLLLGLYWVRWWSLRVPHTWWDEAQSFKA